MRVCWRVGRKYFVHKVVEIPEEVPENVHGNCPLLAFGRTMLVRDRGVRPSHLSIISFF